MRFQINNGTNMHYAQWDVLVGILVGVMFCWVWQEACVCKALAHGDINKIGVLINNK